MSSAHDKYVALQGHRNAAPLALDPRTTALVVVDMQEYFLNPASPFSQGCERVVPASSTRPWPPSCPMAAT